jgi:hypothetical protein
MASIIRNSIFVIIVICTIIILPTNSISKSKKTIVPITKIIYYYYDSSVPQKYHRSYTITITVNKARIIVDSYGDILNDKEFDVDSSQFVLIKKSLMINKIKKGKKLESKGCTGGTSEKIEYFDRDKNLFSASVYHCGNKDYGDMRGNINNLANDIKSLIPNFSELLKRNE